MLNFCPHCGKTIGGLDQIPGKMLTCQYCGKPIGVVAPPPAAKVVDAAAELIQRGVAARCPQCQQVVEVRSKATGKTFVPHYGKAAQRKLCPGSGKAV